VVDGQLSAEDVVDRNRTVRVRVADPVDDHDRGAVPSHLTKCRVGRVHGRDQDSLATHDLVRYEPGFSRSRRGRLGRGRVPAGRACCAKVTRKQVALSEFLGTGRCRC